MERDGLMGEDLANARWGWVQWALETLGVRLTDLVDATEADNIAEWERMTGVMGIQITQTISSGINIWEIGMRQKSRCSRKQDLSITWLWRPPLWI